jgi:hypothetical protein
VAVSRRGCTRETDTKGGGVEVNDDGGEADNDGLEKEDSVTSRNSHFRM